MNKLNFLLCSTALSASLFGVAGRAQAGTITQTASTGGYLTTPYSGDLLSFVGYTGGQQLQSVVVTITDKVQGTVTGSNTSTSTLTFNSSVENTLSITSQPSNLSLPTVIDISNPSGVESIGAGASYTSPTLTGSKSGHSTASNPLTDFTTAWSITLAETGSYFGSADAGVVLSAATEGDVIVKAVYTYSNAAPEPMSIALLGAGMAGIGVVRRRRSRT